MAKRYLKTIFTMLVSSLFAANTVFATELSVDEQIKNIAESQGKTAAKIGTSVNSSAILNSFLPKNLPDNALKKSPVNASLRAVVGGINFTSADVDNVMIPFATKNAVTLQNLFHDGGEWPGFSGDTTNDDGVGSGENQAKEIYDYDGNKHYPKACLRYIGSHCYIFVPVMFFPTLPKTLSSSEAETPKAYASWNMSWPHNPLLKYSPDATDGTVLEPRFILGSDKATAKLALSKIADEFDANIYPKIREYLGTEPDIDGDPKVFIFLDDIRDTNNTNIGYFYAGNQLPRSSVAVSNEKEILFLDIYHYYMNRETLMGTVAHEFSHMIMFNEAYSVQDGVLKGLQVWLEEGITEYMEFLYKGKYPSNLDYFIKNPDVVLVDDRDSTWHGTSPFANYGASFLWTYYCVEKYGYANIPNFLKSVVRAKVDGGIENYNSVFKASNTTMQKVFQDWVIANYLDKVYKSDGATLLNEGKWGYKVDADKDTSNDIGYNQKLPVPATENFILSSEMNTRSGSVNSWAGDCIALTGNNGSLNIAFDGSNNGTFACAVVKKGTSVDTTCEFMTLDANQAGNLVVQNYGTTGTYETILLIPMVCSNYNYEKLSYVYSGSFDDLKVAIFPNPIYENFLHIVVRTDKEFASEPRVQMTFNGKQGYLVMSPINSSTYMTNFAVTADGEGTIVCSGTNKNGVILSNSLNFSASYYARGSSGSLSASYAAVEIPKDALSSDGTVVLASGNNTTSYEGIVRMSKNVDLALPVDQADKALNISIPISSDISLDKTKAGLYRATTSGHKWVGPVTIVDGKAKGNIDISASLFVAADETAPVISNKLESRGNGRYAVKVSDMGSGVCGSTVKVTCDGKEVKSTYADDVVVFDTSDSKAASRNINIEISDNSGNTARASMRAVVGSNALSQIAAWPNPAKNHSIIRATITGANVNGGTGSVKIYDVSGHKVMDGTLVEGAAGVYEFDWNLVNKKNKGVANGVYYADVRITVDGNSYKERIKIAVLR
ncbi:MAG: hypothetical protein II961_07170 [Candidatus Riflebacteria bacterium]|nr:hypothetical protein [Candidatus Riflebacteria bacterium]